MKIIKIPQLIMNKINKIPKCKQTIHMKIKYKLSFKCQPLFRNLFKLKKKWLKLWKQKLLNKEQWKFRRQFRFKEQSIISRLSINKSKLSFRNLFQQKKLWKRLLIEFDLSTTREANKRKKKASALQGRASASWLRFLARVSYSCLMNCLAMLTRLLRLARAFAVTLPPPSMRVSLSTSFWAKSARPPSMALMASAQNLAYSSG